MTEKVWAWRIRSAGPTATGPPRWEPGTGPEPAPGHLLQELQVRSVTADTRADTREFLCAACEHHLQVRAVSCSLADTPRAVADLASGWGTSGAVLLAD
ncbi:hypothetical protein [Amycolatopsis sp. FDAARGOS 1241]|uniref:hypothetical protein n=1 Tax=Amycolatopsis sp. FDAARGOS 1241 TaxID=2778070 RepID=UPI0019511CDB|nr:hypothetical protein [Amycolatopsis sp. FDAARGOS 1241]QRP42912.1 hypothetical protein I6J71_25985 [Amycolatopsis sp. FDAARGOS 1241]